MNKKVITGLLIFSLSTGGVSTASAGNKYYGYEERDHHGGDHHMSNTEKAVAGVLVGALAIAAANAAAQHKGNPAPGEIHSGYRPPRPAPSGYRAQDDVIIFRIPAAGGGVVPVYIRKTPSGYTGPRGEYYASMPTLEKLRNSYGGWSHPQPSARPAPPQVSVEQGVVRVIRDGRTVCRLRPAMPFVEKYALTNDNGQIIIKSRGGHGPAAVELFNLSDGSLDDKVLAYAIAGGQPAWAAGFED